MGAEYLFPTITKAMLVDSKIKLDRTFVVIRGEKTIPLIEEQLPKSDDERERRLNDETSSWDRRSEPVQATFTLEVGNPLAFYGEFGVAAKDAKLGIGIEWKAKDSKIRGYLFLGYITESEQTVVLGPISTIIKDFNSDVSFRVVIFVSEPGTLEEGQFRGNEQGLVLGKADAFKICVEGKGSVFPLSVTSKEGEPLWTVFARFEDPYSEPFDDEHVRVVFSSSNPAYPFINEEAKEFNMDFMKEVFASAFSALLLEIRSKYDEKIFDLERNSDPGSIHTAIKYFNSARHIDVNGSPAELSRTVVSFIEKEYK